MSWQSTMIPGRGPNGTKVLSVIAKRTYEFAPGSVVLAGEQLPLNTADLPADQENPYYSENLAETDMVPYKPFTDIVLVGKAYAPKGKKAYHLDSELSVGPARKTIRVFGERKLDYKLLRGVSFTDPVPFDCAEIGYSNTFGGLAKSKDGTLFPFPPNPIGKGFCLKGGFEEYSEIPVPQVEDPDQPIDPEAMIADKFDNWKKAPKPVSLGWTKQSFFPRFTYAGIIPELPGAYAAGYQLNPALPKCDIRFYQGASEGLCNHVLAGTEHVSLTYLDPAHPAFEFDLPGERPAITIKTGSNTKPTNPVLQTLLIFKEFNTLVMVWRGSIEVGSRIDDLAKLKSSYEIG